MKKFYSKPAKVIIALFLTTAGLLSTTGMATAADYTIDPTHTFVEFRIQHLGYSWLYGRFNRIKGSFSHDANATENNTINLEIDTTSIDTNHAERDKHLRSKKFLNVTAFPTATFNATAYTGNANKGVLSGDLTLHGTTKSINIEITKVGEGKDPWGGYRTGFSGTITLTPSDFGIDYNLGPASSTMQMRLGIEGIRN